MMQLQQITEAALVLGTAFEVDVNQTDAQGRNNQRQQFGVDGSDAMVYDYSSLSSVAETIPNELLSSIFEYSTQFKNLGFTADEML